MVRRVNQNSSLIRLLISAGIALALALTSAACSRNKAGYTVRPEFSVNVGKVDADWPEKIENLSLAEQEMLKMRGRPQLVHVWYVPGVEIVDKMTIRRLDPGASKQISWIYLTNQEEIIFTNETQWEVKPLGPKIKLICELGDPQEIRRIPDAQGRLVEQYRFYNQGRIVTFIDGLKVKEDYMEAMPHYLTN